MTIRLWGIGFALLAVLALDVQGAAAQLSGRVVFREGPVGVDVVLGGRPEVRVTYRRSHGRVVIDRQPARYEPGMSLIELERYRGWVEAEYRTFKRMDEDEAYYRFGWTEHQLDDYVDWLKDERSYLKREHKRLRRLIRDQRRHDDREWRGDWDDDDWEDYWEDRDDWDDDWEDDDDWDDDDRPRRGRRGRGRGR